MVSVCFSLLYDVVADPEYSNFSHFSLVVIRDRPT